MTSFDSTSHGVRSTTARVSPRARHAFLLVLVTLAGVEFAIRGPVRWVVRGNHDRMTDLTGPYLGARAWVRGLDPYEADVFWTMSEQVGLPSDRIDRPADDFQSHTPYPLTTFALLAPLAVLDWPSTRVAALVAMTIASLLAIRALASLDEFRRAPVQRYVFAAFALALAPLHSSIGAGNPVAIAVPLVALAFAAATRGEDAIGGLLLAAAICVKPPIAVPIAGYYALRRRWTIVGAAAAGVSVVAAIAVARMAIAGTPWLDGYLRNNQQLVADHGGSIIRYTLTQYQFINLQYLGFILFDDTRTANMVALAIAGLLGACWLALVLTRTRDASDLLEISALAVISLLPFYHRVYDASLLLLPLAWALSEWDSDRVWLRNLALAAMVVFLVPGGTIAEMLTRADRIPEWLASQWWWYAVVAPHQSWALLVLGVTLVLAQARLRWRDPLVEAMP